jgi:hypothetical protein
MVGDGVFESFNTSKVSLEQSISTLKYNHECLFGYDYRK